MKDLYEKLLIINPKSGQTYDDYIVEDNGQKTKYRIYSWLSKDDQEHIVSAMNFPKSLRKYCKYQGITSQIYYDIIVLGITEIDQRPKCQICGNDVKFLSMKHGYQVTCSKTCHKKLKE